jgi:hypothetical protein
VRCDQLPVPTKQPLRRHDPRPQHLARQHPGKRGQHEAVLRLQPRTSHLPTQHRNLMPQHQQFDVLRRLATAAGHDESKQHPEGRIQSAEQHSNDHAEPSKHTTPRFLNPTGHTTKIIGGFGVRDGCGPGQRVPGQRSACGTPPCTCKVAVWEASYHP